MHTLLFSLSIISVMFNSFTKSLLSNSSPPCILPFTTSLRLRLSGCLVGYLWMVINVGRKYLLSLSYVQRKVQSKCLPPDYGKPKVADVSLAHILVRCIMGYLYGHTEYLYGHIGHLYGHMGNLYADSCVLDMYTRHTRL